MEQIKERFDVIRPYVGDEVQEAVQRVVLHPLFKGMLQYLFGENRVHEAIEDFKTIDTIESFQTKFSSHAVRRVIEKTAESFSFGGLENLDPSRGYLFVSNHRDIVLDSAIMQWVLLDNGHRTSQITFGSNLMSSQFIVDLGKLNKMFTLYRGGSRIEQYRNALLHSAYIRHTVSGQNESVWIAQRDGRTKDGDDKTQVALIKMFALGDKDVCHSLEALNIVPVSISYEYEPCAITKVRECYTRATGNTYVKHPNEDFESVMNGITGKKGRVHMEFGKPLNEFLRELSESDLDQNERCLEVAAEIDRQIYLSYKLSAFNYIAFDRIEGNSNHSGTFYSMEDVELFDAHQRVVTDSLEGDADMLKGIFLKIYASPLANSLTIS